MCTLSWILADSADSRHSGLLRDGEKSKVDRNDIIGNVAQHRKVVNFGHLWVRKVDISEQLLTEMALK